MKYFGSLFFLLVVHAAIAQNDVVLENNAPSVKWYKINTPHFRILYPRGFEEQAQRMANTLEHIHDPEATSMGVNPRRISVVLQSQSATSNGFVSMLPRRSEFYAMPPQNYNFLGTNDWLNLLASHEYRHVVQFQRASTGFNKLLYYVFGSATYSAVAQTSVPQWFWEGDAVNTETAFTHSGRGRIPNFGLVFRTNLLEGRTFNYHKQYLRSYKHNIPDHYVLGYYMVNYLRRQQQSADAWEEVTRRTWSVPFVPFAFSNAIKKQSGRYVTQLYRDMAADLTKRWQDEISQLTLTGFEPVHTPKRSGYTDYKYPQVLTNGKVLAMKEGIGDIEQFVLVSDAGEKRVFTPGFINDTGMLSIAGSLVVWNEYGYDPRWMVRNYSVIKFYDVEKGRLKIVTKKSRYAGAALSPDQRRIVTVETTTAYQTALTVLDTAGVVIRQFPNPDNSFYAMPRWSQDGQHLVALKTKSGQRSIVILSPDGNEERVFTLGEENAGHPVLTGTHVFFNSPVSGIDNIYAINLATGQRYQVTCSKYGAYNPAINPAGDWVYYNEQTRDGLSVVKIPMQESDWKPYVPAAAPVDLTSVLATQEAHPDLLTTVPAQAYQSKRYHTLSGVVNPYSWGAVFNTSFTAAEIGIASQDVLSTTSTRAGYVYDLYERQGAWRAGVSMQRWLPILDVTASYAKRSVNEGNLTLLAIDTVSTSPLELDSTYFTRNATFKWTEKKVEAGFRIPLVTTSSRFYGNVSFANYVGYTQVSDFRNSINNSRVIPFVYRSGPSSPLQPGNDPYFYFFRDYLDKGNLVYNRFQLSAYRLLKMSRRDINSKWGQTVNLTVYNTPYGGDYSGSQVSLYTVMYFPGLMKHHSLWGYWAYQGSKLPGINVNTGSGLDNYVFNNQIPLPRGQSVARFQNFYSMSVNYTLPVWYPDIAIGPLVNLQRLRANGFLDYGAGKSQFGANTVSATYTTIGVEAKVDINIMRALPQLNLGVRYSYGLQPSVTKFEFLIGTFNF